MLKAFLAIVLFAGVAQAQDADTLLQKTVTLQTANLDAVLTKTESNVEVFAQNFHVVLDSKSKITTAPAVSGTVMNPVYTVSVQKCVLFFCQTINIDADFSLKTSAAPNCTRHYNLLVDLQRSSQMLTNLYSSIDADICIQKNATGAQAALTVTLNHAPNYDTGLVQEQAYDLISLQGQAILSAFETVMKTNGASVE